MKIKITAIFFMVVEYYNGCKMFEKSKKKSLRKHFLRDLQIVLINIQDSDSDSDYHLLHG